MRENKELLVIGGSTYDITGKIKGDAVSRDSNPSAIYTSSGGVGRNIAENTARLGVKTAFITAVGDDVFGREIVDSCENAGIDTSNFIVGADKTSSVYITILDSCGELVMASSDLTILEETPVELMKMRADYIRSFPIVCLDTNLTSEMLEALADITASDGHEPKQGLSQLIYADTVSVKKAARLLGIIDRVHTLKANRTELEALTGFKVEDTEDAAKAMGILREKGVKRVFVTLGMQGSCVLDDEGFSYVPAVPCEVRDVTGAGDSFMSAVIYGSLSGCDNREILYLGTAAAHLALSAKGAVNRSLNEQTLMDKYKKIAKLQK